MGNPAIKVLGRRALPSSARRRARRSLNGPDTAANPHHNCPAGCCHRHVYGHPLHFVGGAGPAVLHNLYATLRGPQPHDESESESDSDLGTLDAGLSGILDGRSDEAGSHTDASSPPVTLSIPVLGHLSPPPQPPPQPEHPPPPENDMAAEVRDFVSSFLWSDDLDLDAQFPFPSTDRQHLVSGPDYGTLPRNLGATASSAPVPTVEPRVVLGTPEELASLSGETRDRPYGRGASQLLRRGAMRWTRSPSSPLAREVRRHFPPRRFVWDDDDDADDGEGRLLRRIARSRGASPRLL